MTSLSSVNFENIQYPNLISKGVFGTLSNNHDGAYFYKNSSIVRKKAHALNISLVC